jgi:hypothetical protein
MAKLRLCERCIDGERRTWRLRWELVERDGEAGR